MLSPLNKIPLQPQDPNEELQEQNRVLQERNRELQEQNRVLAEQNQNLERQIQDLQQGVLRQPWISVVLLGLLIVSVALNIVQGVGAIPRSRVKSLTTTTLPFTNAKPILDSFLGATAIKLSIPFTLNPQNETKLAYNSDGDKICLRTKSKGAW